MVDLREKSNDSTLNLREIVVLILDKNEFSRNFLKHICDSFQFKEVIATGDQTDALTILKTGKAQLLLCDWMITPSGAGDFIRQVRYSSLFPNQGMPIIVLSSVNDQKTLQTAREIGINAWLVRPITMLRLVTCLEMSLKIVIPFIKTLTYVGPCRRRKQREFQGKDRRSSEKQGLLFLPGLMKLSRSVKEAGGLTVDKMIEVSEAVVKREEIIYKDIRKNDLDELFGLIRTLKENKSSPDEMIKKIYYKVNDIRAYGQTFGYPLLTKVGDLMSELIQHLPPDPMRVLFFLQAIEMHATVMKMILDSQIQDEKDELVDELMVELKTLVDKVKGK